MEVRGEVRVVISRLAGLLPIQCARRLAVWGLILVQAQLLWVAEFHRHEAEQISSAFPVVVHSSDGASKPLAARLLCVACQVSRENAARPAPGLTAAALGPVVPLGFMCSFFDFSLTRVNIVPARAPPVF